MSTASERRSSARTSVVWEALRDRLPVAGGDVLDIGGGTGGFAVRVAELGHRVSVIDPSPDALAALDRRAGELGVAVAGQQGDLSNLLEVAGPASADVVLCHGVLEVVSDPGAALATIAEVLRPGGTLSLLVAQQHAAVIARAMAGHFGQALELLESTDPQTSGRVGRRFTAEQLTELLLAAGFEIDDTHAIRVFADLVPGALLDLEPGATSALVALDRAVAERPEYLPLAAQIHLLAHR